MLKLCGLREGDIYGEIYLPLSKSVSNRVLIIKAQLGERPYDGSEFAVCDDTTVMLDALRTIAADCGESSPILIDVGASGTAYRFLTALLASMSGEFLLTGCGRMKSRPIAPLVGALRNLGANIEYAENDGFPPLLICGGGLEGGGVSIDATVSSQFVSALMLIAPKLSGGLTVELCGTAVSSAYIALTADVMRKFGADVKLTENGVSVAGTGYRDSYFSVEADWSAASYWYSLLAVTRSGELRLKNLRRDSMQPDRKVADIFGYLGVETTYLPDEIVLSCKEKSASGVDLDCTDVPDISMTIAVTCCACGMPFRLGGLSTLADKECDRLVAMRTELGKFGFDVVIIGGDTLMWNGERAETPGDGEILLHTYGDHRIAMAFAPMACIMPFNIDNEKVVAKSYPDFWNHLSRFMNIE